MRADYGVTRQPTLHTVRFRRLLPSMETTPRTLESAAQMPYSRGCFGSRRTARTG